MGDRPAVLALDGGGTKVACAVVGSDGRLLGFGLGGSVNHNFVAEDRVRTSVIEAITAAMVGVHGAPALACVAGPISEDVASEILSSLAGVHRIEHISESDSVLHADGTVQEAVVVIAGTGSLATAYRKDGSAVTVGGWGTLLGDEGSAYWIALEALKACTRSLDRRGPSTLLLARLLCHLGVESMWDVAADVYRGHLRHRERLAALAILVFQAASEGDAVAERIIHQAGRELALLAVSAVQQLGLNPNHVPCLCSGGVFQSGGAILGPMQQVLDEVAPGLKARRVRWEPVTGAVSLGFRKLGHPLTHHQLRCLGVAIGRAYGERKDLAYQACSRSDHETCWPSNT